MTKPNLGVLMREDGSTIDLVLSIGSVVGRLRLAGLSQAMATQIGERYDAFTLPPAADIEVAFSLALTFRPAPTVADRSAQMQARPLKVDLGAERIAAVRWDFELALEAADGTFNGHGGCEESPLSFDTLLRVLWSIFLPRAQGALFHACGLRHGDDGVLVPGRAGTGKTALSETADDVDYLLSDEIVAVLRDREGRWRISGTPFWGAFRQGGTSLRSWPLGAIVFLDHRGTTELLPLGKAEAMFRAMECLVSFEESDETIERNMAMATALSSEVGTHTCRHGADLSVAALLDALDPVMAPSRGDRVSPQSKRELISEFRAYLKRHRSYTFRPRGARMQPWLEKEDSLFVQAAAGGPLVPGDVLLCWRPGATADDDTLTCQRLVAPNPEVGSVETLPRRETHEGGESGEILGKVWTLSNDGQISPVPERMRSLAIPFGALVALPILDVSAH